MIFFSIGLSSRFAEWCDAVTARLVQRSLGAVEVIAASTIEEFALASIKTRSPNMLVCSRRMLGPLRTAICQAGRRSLVALDDPRLALHDLVVRQGLSFVEATRAISNSCAAVVSCVSMPGALVLRADRDAKNPRVTAEAIARHLELPVSEDGLTEIIEEVASLGLVAARTESDFWWAGLDESRRVLMNGALEAYADHFSNGNDLGPITWERELFYMGKDPPDPLLAPASEPIDITGRPRFLVYGPYMTLPPGPWSANVTLGFSKEAAEMTYTIDIMADAARQLTHIRIQPGNERIVEAQLHFSIDDALAWGIEVRIQNERAAFEGRLALGDVTFTPHGHIRSDTREFITAAIAG
jgi:hypothetical protein